MLDSCSSSLTALSLNAMLAVALERAAMLGTGAHPCAPSRTCACLGQVGTHLTLLRWHLTAGGGRGGLERAWGLVGEECDQRALQG